MFCSLLFFLIYNNIDAMSFLTCYKMPTEQDLLNEMHYSPHRHMLFTQNNFTVHIEDELEAG